MIEYIKKADVIEIMKALLPKDIAVEYIYDLKGVWLDGDEADTPQTDSEVTRNSLRTDCTGCKFVGLYDADFPCVNCTRKNKDYYTVEQTERSKIK